MPTYPNDADGDALARLAARGVDLSRPLRIEFAVEAPDEQTARAIGESLTRHGYQVCIDSDEGEPGDPREAGFGPSWTVYTEMRMAPAYEELVRVQAELDRIAAPLGGRSDGWGVLFDSEDTSA